MAKPVPHLPNAPIKEAVIDIRVHSHPELKIEWLEAVTGLLAPDYFKKGPIVEFEFAVTQQGGNERSSRSASRALGVRLHSKDEKFVGQFARHGMTVSRLAPYEHWDNLLVEARRLWQVYVQCAKPARVSRIAARFINDLQLPMQPGEHFEEYLATPPQVPAGLPQAVVAFLYSVVIHNPDSDCSATLTQSLQSGNHTERIPVILDIDVYRSAEYDVGNAEIWSCLQQLREFKNLAFFESLTDKAVELYR
jgi:uncharacterized protein (TIGR04255 family)